MNYLKFDLGHQQQGKLVKILIKGNAANVRLLDHKNMFNYEHDHEFTSVSTFAQTALTELRIPREEHWFVVVDMKGVRKAEGRVDATVSVV